MTEYSSRCCFHSLSQGVFWQSSLVTINEQKFVWKCILQCNCSSLHLLRHTPNRNLLSTCRQISERYYWRLSTNLDKSINLGCNWTDFLVHIIKVNATYNKCVSTFQNLVITMLTVITIGIQWAIRVPSCSLWSASMVAGAGFTKLRFYWTSYALRISRWKEEALKAGATAVMMKEHTCKLAKKWESG